MQKKKGNFFFPAQGRDVIQNFNCQMMLNNLNQYTPVVNISLVY